MDTTDKRKTQEVLTLFVPIPILKYLEPFDTPIDMLNKDSIFR